MEVAMKKVMKVPQVPKRDNPVTVLSVEKKAPAVSMPPSIDEFIERLTIGEARRLHQKLDSMFRN